MERRAQKLFWLPLGSLNQEVVAVSEKRKKQGNLLIMKLSREKSKNLEITKVGNYQLIN